MEKCEGGREGGSVWGLGLGFRLVAVFLVMGSQQQRWRKEGNWKLMFVRSVLKCIIDENRKKLYCEGNTLCHHDMPVMYPGYMFYIILVYNLNLEDKV